MQLVKRGAHSHLYAEGNDGYLHAVYCQARLGNGLGCIRKAVEEVRTDQKPVALCKLHRGVLGTRGGITLRDGSCIANQDGRGYCWYPDARVGLVEP